VRNSWQSVTIDPSKNTFLKNPALFLVSAMWKRKTTPRASSPSGAAPQHLFWTAGSHPAILLPRPSNTPTVLTVLGKLLNNHTHLYFRQLKKVRLVTGNYDTIQNLYNTSFFTPYNTQRACDIFTLRYFYLLV
jgi:hypothetical protein